MGNPIQRAYEKIAVHTLGYEGAIHFEEVILVLFGIIIGGLLIGAILTNFMRKIHKVDDNGHRSINITRFTAKGKTWYTVKFGKFTESFRQVFKILLSTPFTVKRFAEEDKRRTRIFMIIIVVGIIVIICLTVLAITSVFTPDDIEDTIRLIYNGI